MTVSTDLSGLTVTSPDVLRDPVRQAAVRRLLAAGTRSEGLDRLTALAAALLEAPFAQVSLLAAEQQHVASVSGLEPAEREGPAEDSLCTVTMRGGGPLAVSEAPTDPRVSSLPPVTSGAVGAYLGVPLADSAGNLLGALCVFDTRPRSWTSDQVGVLGELAPAVVAELELRAVTLEVATAAARLDLALSSADIGSFDYDMDTGELTWDDRLVALFGYEPGTYTPTFAGFEARLHPEDREEVLAALEAARTTGTFSREYRIVVPEGGVRWIEARGRVLRGRSGRSERMLGAAYDASWRHEADEQRERAYREREQAVVERERAYAQAEAANTRLQVLVDATSRLSASLEPVEVLETLAATVVPALGRWVVVAAPAELAAGMGAAAAPASSTTVVPVLVRHGDAGQQDALAGLVSRLPITTEDPYGVGAVLRTGVPEWLPEVTDAVLESFGFDDELLEGVRGLQVGRAFTVPLLSRGRRLGALTVAEPLTGVLDRALLLDLAARAAVALDNALLYRAERRTGITLQRSLLPREVPALPGLQAAARYLPGDDGAFVGGDWYQGVVVGDGLVVAMGDVMGHGMRSAARMGQLKAIVGTLALEGHGPGDLLSRLSRSVDDLLDVELATLLVARLDPVTGALCVASAGHPPPLLAVPGAEPAFVPVVPGPPLGTFPGEYAETDAELPAGAALLLYTDGLVEDRGSALGTGLERLRQALAAAPDAVEEAADHVLAATGRRGGADDDIALLLLRRSAQ
jgi:serine phosphatase RsbU (regulator of sigma subunit)/PAS domain-containing protein